MILIYQPGEPIKVGSERDASTEDVRTSEHMSCGSSSDLDRALRPVHTHADAHEDAHDDGNR